MRFNETWGDPVWRNNIICLMIFPGMLVPVWLIALAFYIWWPAPIEPCVVVAPVDGLPWSKADAGPNGTYLKSDSTCPSGMRWKR